MVGKSNKSLDFDVVVQQFAEAADSLNKVREQLQSLASLREEEEKVTSSIQETAGQVANFSAEAAKNLKGLNEAQEKMVEALKAGADLLNGSELKTISQSVTANSEAISNVQDRVDTVENKLDGLASAAGSLEASILESFSGLNKEISKIQKEISVLRKDVKEPVIVKRLF